MITVINEACIRSIISMATCDDRVKQLLYMCSHDEGGIVEFIYNTICFCVPDYADIDVSDLHPDTIAEAKCRFIQPNTSFYKNMGYQIRLIDPFDSLYRRSNLNGYATTIDSNSLDFLYAALEDNVGTQDADAYFSGVVELLEHIICTIESSYLRLHNEIRSTQLIVFLAYSQGTMTVFVQQ